MSGCRGPVGGGCVARRWAGTSSCSEKPSNPTLVKEFNDGLAALQAQRANLDKIWEPLAKEEQTQIVVQQPQVEGKIAVPIFDKKKTRGF